MEPRDLPEEARHLAALAADVMTRVAALRLTVTTAESCTGGLIASLITDLPGLSKAFERGFVTYSEEAKCELLGVDPVEIVRHGVVSGPIARAMANGALERSTADLALAITGFAGPGGKGDEAGLVHLAVRPRGGRLIARECHYGEVGRDRVRMLAAQAALEMLAEATESFTSPPPPTAGT